MAKIIFDHVTKEFVDDKKGRVKAVDDSCFTVEDQEFMVFVGPSGCGKTTSLRMIAGLERQTSGNIYIGDRVVNNLHPKERDIAMVFQDYALYPHMTIYENLAFGLKNLKTPKLEIEAKVKRASEILGLGDLLERRPRELSGGQRQRVALGRAIVRNPKVFLFDEPLSNLDAKLRVQMRVEIAELHKALGTTIVYVTHDQVEAMTLGQRIVVMNRGVIQQIATPDNLYNKPANMFVAGFIGAPAMNFLNCRIEQKHFVIDQDTVFGISQEYQKLCKPLIGREIVLGIRPEDIYDPHLAPNLKNPGTLHAAVKVVEKLGAENLFYFDRAGVTVTARISAQSRVMAGEHVELLMDLDKVHLFDKESGMAIR